MSVDRLINLVVTITLIAMMVTAGLRVTFRELVDTLRNRSLVTRAVLANDVAVLAARLVSPLELGSNILNPGAAVLILAALILATNATTP